MIETIKIGKTNLLTQCIRYFLNDFDCQQQMSYIDENLTKIYLMLNKMLERNIVNLQLDYQYSDLWDIVQKSEVYLSDSRHIEEASDFELVNLCIDIIKQLLEINPEKTMIVEILITLLIIFLVYASCNIRSNIYLKVFCKKQTEDKIVAITFDDGPDPVQTPKVLQVLKEQQIPACFFCIGVCLT